MMPFDPLPREVTETLPYHDDPETIFEFEEDHSLPVWGIAALNYAAIEVQARTKSGEPCRVRVIVDGIGTVTPSASVQQTIHSLVAGRHLRLKRVRKARHSGWIHAQVIQVQSNSNIAQPIVFRHRAVVTI